MDKSIYYFKNLHDQNREHSVGTLESYSAQQKYNMSHICNSDIPSSHVKK